MLNLFWRNPPDERLGSKEAPGAANIVTISARNIILFFAFSTMLLLAASISIDLLKYKTSFAEDFRPLSRLFPMFDIDREDSFFTLLSSLMFLSCSALAYMISEIDRTDRVSWRGICLVSLVLFFDESVMLHEASWKIPAALAVVIFAFTKPVRYLGFLARLHRKTLWFFVAAALTYLAGALVMDALNSPYIKAFGQDNLGYRLRATLEETLEAAGALLFVVGLLHHLSRWGVKELYAGTSAHPSPHYVDRH